MVTKNLRLSDLTNRSKHGTVKLLSVRLPVQLIDRIDLLVRRLGSGKAEVVVALLNEGLDRFDSQQASGRRSRRAAS